MKYQNGLQKKQEGIKSINTSSCTDTISPGDKPFWRSPAIGHSRIRSVP